MQFLAPILTFLAISEALTALLYLKRFPFARLPAATLLAIAPLQVLVCLFGESWLAAMHTPSSIDPIGDRFPIFFQWIGLVFVSAMAPGIMCIWLAICAARQ